MKGKLTNGGFVMKYKVMYDGIVIGMYNVISNSCVEYTIDKNGIDELIIKSE